MVDEGKARRGTNVVLGGFICVGEEADLGLLDSTELRRGRCAREIALRLHQYEVNWIAQRLIKLFSGGLG